MSFGTWRSLCVDLRLSNASAVDLMVAMTAAAADEAAHLLGRSAMGSGRAFRQPPEAGQRDNRHA